MEKTILIIVNVIASLFYLFCVFVFFGKGGSLIAGYNFSPKGKKAKKYHMIIMKAYSVFLFLFMASLHVLIIASILNMDILRNVFIGMVILVFLVGVYVFYFNKKIKRIKKLEKEFSENPKYEDEFSKNDIYYEYFHNIEENEEKAVTDLNKKTHNDE